MITIKVHDLSSRMMVCIQKQKHSVVQVSESTPVIDVKSPSFARYQRAPCGATKRLAGCEVYLDSS